MRMQSVYEAARNRRRAEPDAIKSRQILVLLSVAEFLGMALWFSASAVLPALTREWNLTSSGQAWMAMAVQLGFVIRLLPVAVDVVGWRFAFAILAVGPALGSLSMWRLRALPEAVALAGGILPTWDATLLAHARRTQILPEPYRPLVFNTKTSHSTSTFLVDGAVAGTWRYEQGRVHLEPFERLPTAVRRELEDEAKRLAAFHAD